MTLLELSLFCLFIWTGFFCGSKLGAIYGTWGWIIGIPFGLLSSILFYAGFCGMIERYDEHFPIRPVCRNGKCKAINYQLAYGDEKIAIFYCLCGDKYQRKGKDFSIVLPDGSVQPYMRHEGIFRGWKPTNKI